MVKIETSDILDTNPMNDIGLTPMMMASAINYVHDILAKIDSTLIENGEDRLGGLVELANLSSIIGNFFRTGIARSSGNRFVANGPHKYPDLLANDPTCRDVEIKVALEDNKPKGHLVKPGPHITCRYVLCGEGREFTRGKENRGSIAAIWEVRVGILTSDHFNESNTPGDSGKTAVINAAGLEALEPVFVSRELCPWSPNGSRYRQAFLQ